MDQKNRLIIAIAVTLLIVAAMFTSFGRSLFSMRTEHIQLPEPGASSSSQEGGGSSQSAELFQRVEVTPQTVQSVIRTLERSTSYYWELTVETFWTGGSSATSVQTWVDGGWSHTRQVLPSGLIRHDLISEDTVYYWYEGSSDYLTARRRAAPPIWPSTSPPMRPCWTRTRSRSPAPATTTPGGASPASMWRYPPPAGSGWTATGSAWRAGCSSPLRLWRGRSCSTA